MPAPKGNKNAKGNRGGGRKPVPMPPREHLAREIAKLGATDEDLARCFGVTERTINAWKADNVDFASALKEGKLIADSLVEASLFHRATGYSHEDTHVSNFQGDITLTPLIKHYPPDTTACIFWLKNRRPAEWRDKTEVVITDEREVVTSAAEQWLETMRNADPSRAWTLADAVTALDGQPGFENMRNVLQIEGVQ